MDLPVIIAIVVGFVAFSIYRTVKTAGPRQLDESEVGRARTLVRITQTDPGTGWDELGSATETDGINLRFSHDDDPQAEARLLAPEHLRKNRTSNFGNIVTVDLTDQFMTHHVHTGGYIFRISLRGDATVSGRQVRIQMKLSGKGVPLAGVIENDDDTDAAVGGWIEIESAEVLEV